MVGKGPKENDLSSLIQMAFRKTWRRLLHLRSYRLQFSRFTRMKTTVKWEINWWKICDEKRQKVLQLQLSTWFKKTLKWQTWSKRRLYGSLIGKPDGDRNSTLFYHLVILDYEKNRDNFSTKCFRSRAILVIYKHFLFQFGWFLSYLGSYWTMRNFLRET